MTPCGLCAFGVCASRINLPTQNTMHTILNDLSLACAESSICSMQVGFIMALAGVPVRELFVCVGYWRRTRVPRARQWTENIKMSDPGQTPKVLQVLFQRNAIEVDPPNHISNWLCIEGRASCFYASAGTSLERVGSDSNTLLLSFTPHVRRSWWPSTTMASFTPRWYRSGKQSTDNLPTPIISYFSPSSNPKKHTHHLFLNPPQWKSPSHPKHLKFDHKVIVGNNKDTTAERLLMLTEQANEEAKWFRCA